MSKKNNSIYLLITLVIITFISLYSCLKNEFVNWDDNILVTENVKIRELSFKNILDFFKAPHAGLYHPLVLLSYALEYKFFKLRPFFYHLTNLILHILNSVMLFLLLLKIEKNVMLSFLISLLFAIHPMHVESVCWVSERKDVLYSFFYLISIMFYTKHKTKNNILFYFLSLVFFLFSLLSKPMAVSLPIVLLLMEKFFFFEKSNNSWKFRLIKITPFFIVAVIFTILTFVFHYSSSVFSVHKSIAFSNLFIGLLFYISKFFLPVNISGIYPLQKEIIYHMKIFEYFLPLILIFPTVIKGIRKKIFFGYIFFLATILPVLNIFPFGLETVADRYTYIPYIGLSYSLCICFDYLYRSFFKTDTIKKILFYILITSIISFYIINTSHRCLVWKNSFSFLNDVIKKYPYISEVYRLRGLEYVKVDKYILALEDFNKSINLNNNNYKAYVSRGNLFAKMGQDNLAMSDYNKAIEISSKYPQAYYNRGLLFAKQKNYDNALKDYLEAVKYKVDFADAYNNIGNIYGIKGDFKYAIVNFNKAIELNPYLAEAYYNRAYAYYNIRDYANAALDLKKSLSLGYNVDKNLLSRITAYSENQN